ncbi:Localization factor PodJL [compost metagenome]
MSADFATQFQQATAGNPDAQFAVAEAYRRGSGVTVDLAKSVRWYRAAAAQGHPMAQNDLGSMLLNGMGTERSPEEAACWYRKAAEQGEAVAQFNLALR